MAPPPAGVTAAAPGALDAPSPAMREEAAALAAVQPLLSTRQALLRAHRKATCWLFFRQVAIRSTENNLETLLSCRICRPDVVTSAAWEEVKGSRGGLVRYSSTSGTSAMRTHVRNVHQKEGMALDRAVAMASMQGAVGKESPLEVAEGGVGGEAAMAASVLGKRAVERPDADAPAPGAGAEGVKRQRAEAKAEIARSLEEMQATIDGLQGSLDAVKRQVQSL